MNIMSHRFNPLTHGTKTPGKPHVNRNVILLSKVVGFIFIIALLAFILW